MFNAPVTTQKAFFFFAKCLFQVSIFSNILIKFEHGPCKTIRFGPIVFPS